MYSQRELDYWAIEALLEKRGPPPVIEFVTTLGSVALRECVLGPLRTDIRSVVDSLDSHSWKSYWENVQELTTPGRFSLDDWDAIGEFCFSLCHCCRQDITMERVRSCMIRIMGHGKFKSVVHL